VFGVHAAAHGNELGRVQGKGRDCFLLPTFNPAGVRLLVSTNSTDATDDLGRPNPSKLGLFELSGHSFAI